MKQMKRGWLVGGLLIAAMAGLWALKPMAGRPGGEIETAVAAQSVATVAAGAAARPAAGDPCAAATNQTPTVRGTLPFVVRSTTPIDKPLRLEIEATGARTITSLSAEALLVEADAAARTRLVADPRFRASGELLPSEKIEPGLAALVAEGAAAIDVSVVSLAEEDRERVRALVAAAGGEILAGVLEGREMFKARLPAGLVATLSARGDVRWLEQFVRPELTNDKAVDPVTMNVRPLWLSEERPEGLSGAGQIITTSDSGIDTGDLETIHPDLRERLIGFGVVPEALPTDKNGHGTHTAGSIVGDGAMSDGRIRGTAWGARLWAWFCGAGDGGKGIKTPDSASELFRPPALTEGTAFIHSASWGAPVNGVYNMECEEFDEYVWRHPDFLPVIAAGNEGSQRGTVSAPGSAKNVLTVGASQNTREGHDGGWGNGRPEMVATFSSRGPCLDGRIKPDVTAPGVGILSTRARGVDYSYGVDGEYYAYDSGTSMATPLTAGAVALVREWLLRRDEYADVETETAKRPTAALMKAIVTGGAKDLLKPDNDKGWGRVDLVNTLTPAGRAVKLVDRIPFEAGKSFTYVVETTNAAPFDVQLVWVDYPGSPQNLRSPQLVNDLDLVVEARVAGEDKIWYGNGGTKPDTLNNVESVRLETAEPTKYVITVACPRILHDYTEGGAAALYVRGAFDADVEPEEPIYLRVKERDLGFRSLAKALEVVEEGETVEVFDTISLAGSVTVGVDCTITATNDDPRASAIVCAPGTRLTVASGARLLLKDVAFASAARAATTEALSLSVQAGGTLAVSGFLSGVERVTTADAGGIELAGAIENPLAIVTPKKGYGETFGRFTGAVGDAASAARLLNAADDELGGEVRGSDLVWGIAPVDDETAVARTEINGTLTNFRSLRLLIASLEDGQSVEILAPCVLGEALTLANRTLTFKGATDRAAIVPKAPITLNAGGELTLSGLVIRDYAGTTAPLLVNGGALTLTDGAMVTNCLNTTGYGGAVLAQAGRLDLLGATIVGCRAKAGGGVFVSQNAKLNIGGETTVFGNFVSSTTDKAKRDNVHVVTPPTVTAPLSATSRVGLCFYRAGKKEGETLATAAAADWTETQRALTVTAFTNDDNENLGATWKDEAYATLVWGPRTVDASDGAAVRVTYPNETVLYYATPEAAFGAIEGDCTVELLTNAVLWSDIAVAHAVRLQSAPADAAFVLARSNGTIRVTSEGALTLSDMTLSASTNTFRCLIDVDGGRLTLASGATVSNFYGKVNHNAASPTAAAVVAHGTNTTVTLCPGATLIDCHNLHYTPDGINSGHGGALLLDFGATANLTGGRIVGSSADFGGAVFAHRASTVNLSGDVVLAGNSNRIDAAWSDVAADQTSRIVVTGLLTDTAEIGRFRPNPFGPQPDVMAEVPDWEAAYGFVALTNMAARFFADEKVSLRGATVTNATTTALIVWPRALADDGSFVVGEGDEAVVYYLAGDRPADTPDEEYVQPEPIAFAKIALNADQSEVTLVFTNAVQWCNYALFATDTLAGGFETEGVDPVTNFQWTVTDPTVEIRLPVNGAQKFWKATAEEGLKGK